MAVLPQRNGPLYQGQHLPTRAGNPFAGAASGLGGVDPWAGMRGSAGGSGMAAMGGTMAPSRRNTYNPMADPQGPLARAGWIGSLIAGSMGGQTRDEFNMEQTGTAQQEAYKQLGSMIQSGMAPQRAIVEFMNTPAGQDFFATGNGLTDLANFVKGITPPPPELITTSAGQQVHSVGADGTVTPIIQTPVSEVQKFNALAELGNLDPTEIQEMARAQMMQDVTGDTSDSLAAMNRLIQQGRITQETADLITAGVLVTTPILDQEGKTIGHGVLDKSKGGIVQLDNQPQGNTAQPGEPGYVSGVSPGSTEEDSKMATNSDIYSKLANPADILDSAGTAGYLIEKLGSFTGMFGPALSPVETVRNRLALQNIKVDAQQLAKDGRVLAQEMGAITSISDTLGPMTQPDVAAVTLLNLHELYDSREVALTELANDPKTTAQVRGDAYTDLANLRRAKANLPDKASLKVKYEQLRKQKPMENIMNNLREGEEKVEQTIDEVTGDSAGAGGMPTYDDEATIRADWKSGKLKKGQTVIYKGNRYPITKNYGE